MTGTPIVTRFSGLRNGLRQWLGPPLRRPRCDLHTYWQHPERLPRWVADSATVRRLLDLLGPLRWDRFPDRNLQRNWGQTTIPYAAFAAACLLQLNEHIVHMSDLRTYLYEHPAFIWLFGFPLVPDPTSSHGFDADASLPTQRHFTRMLRKMPNTKLQFLLSDSLTAILTELATLGCTAVAQATSLDTKHVLAWVKQNNPKAYVTDRFDKTQQPAGDPDCKLGCKRRHNQRTTSDDVSTPASYPVPFDTLSVGEYYWGYGSGVVATKVPDWGEFVLAELTQTFNRSDISYFFPLVKQTDERLGFRPRTCAMDAGFDAFYVYEYFHRDDDPDAFAAVPFVQKGGYKVTDRRFNPEGLPLCAAGLAMPLRFTYTDRTVTLIEHERGKYGCPLQDQESQENVTCPVDEPRWAKNGCTTTMPTSIGARIRYTLDRQGEAYKDAYRQRTATERINSQAKALGIERPHLRNGQAITNRNTLIYTLINLRCLHRIRHRRPAPD
jgi:hypothetical protein